MRYGSVCSGIEAASVAWHPLGWTPAWFAEIEPFPSAVLAHHYPAVANLGDMSQLPEAIALGHVEAPDILCGGTPCQAFSVAGLRQSLSDARGNLSLTFCEIANAIDLSRAHDRRDPCIVFWENVPGVLSTKDNAFGCFLAGLAGEDDALVAPGGRWADAGVVLGPTRAVAWRVLDAQYFGLAQRRRRVFVVASARADLNPAAVLFEWEGVRRDTAPSREAGKAASTIPARSTGGGGLETDFDCDGGVIRAFGGNNQAGPIDVATARNACASASGRMDFETETFLVQPVVHSLRGEGFDASEDGTGRGTPLVPVAFHPTQDPISSTDGTTHAMGCGSKAGTATVAVAIRTANTGANGHGISPEVAHTLDRAQGQAIAFAQNQRDEVRVMDKAGALAAEPGAEQQTYVAVAYGGDVAGTLDANYYKGAGSANFGEREFIAQPVAFRDTADCLTSAYGTKWNGNASADNGSLFAAQQVAAVHQAVMQVRRLTPTECERLQGFPDGYTAIPWRGKAASECPDGPRYKALGNSWAVPCVRWIGWRIAAQVYGELA